jgi:hypothetical protein
MDAAALSRRQTAVVSAILRVLEPEYPELDEVERASAHGDVTRYVAAQIQGMPTHLRLPYKLALLAFDCLPLLRHLHRFVSLPAASQRDYLALWTDSPIGPMRDFVKLIRSSGLLVYYDHPLLTRRLVAGRKR